MFRKVLLVCVGNICRSPAAEVMLRAAVSGRDLEVASAGLAAMAGRPMDATSKALLQEVGLDGSAHKARQIDDELLRWADLILVMELKHLDRIVAVAPHTTGKAFLLGKWQSEREIPDPYRQQRAAFEHVHGLIEEAVAGWCRYL
ncbi:MAG: low molecular weight protein-tyrosine-phosphatase [Stenotrophomonas sp.]|uniref:low molecular weight protein-tyrosine-phosphatase n=1 Tax=Stenotrophomonas sp. TaxID=69392 RepID=UPI003D6D7462